MILYYSATGNSKFVARQLSTLLQDECICANSYIREGTPGSFHSEKPWIFVFPIYLSTIPTVFADWIERSAFSGADRAYFIATCASVMGSAPNDGWRISTAKGWHYQGAAALKMPQDYLMFFRMHTPEECRSRIEEAARSAEALAERIRSGQILYSKSATTLEYHATKAVEKFYNRCCTVTAFFRAGDGCVGCGLCERVCPMKNIRLSDGKPQWGRNCIHCTACINRCPKEAIEFGRLTAGKRRYYCEKYRP